MIDEYEIRYLLTGICILFIRSLAIKTIGKVKVKVKVGDIVGEKCKAEKMFKSCIKLDNVETKQKDGEEAELIRE